MFFGMSTTLTSFDIVTHSTPSKKLVSHLIFFKIQGASAFSNFHV